MTALSLATYTLAATPCPQVILQRMTWLSKRGHTRSTSCTDVPATAARHCTSCAPHLSAMAKLGRVTWCCVMLGCVGAGGGHKASAEALQQAIEEKYGDKYKVCRLMGPRTMFAAPHPLPVVAVSLTEHPSRIHTLCCLPLLPVLLAAWLRAGGSSTSASSQQ